MSGSAARRATVLVGETWSDVDIVDWSEVSGGLGRVVPAVALALPPTAVGGCWDEAWLCEKYKRSAMAPPMHYNGVRHCM
jgi:hypothetical protein